MKLALRILLFVLLCSHTLHLKAQSTANYTFTNSTNGSFIDISSGSTTLIGPGLDGLNFGVLSPTNPIGFSFYYMSQPYNEFTVTEDGALRLGSSTAGIAIPPSLSSNEPRLIIFGCDMSTGTNGKVHFKITGNSPNRVLVVEWKNVNIRYSDIPAAGSSSFQIRLYEGTGKIEYVYGYMNVESRGQASSWSDIGFTNGTSNNQVLSKSVSFTGTDINRNVPPTSLLNELFPPVGVISGLSSSADGSRRVYTFTPRVPPLAPTFGNCTATTTSVTLNWNDNSNNETGFYVYCSADSGANYTLISQLAQNTNTFTINNLPSNQSFKWKLYAVNEGASSAEVFIDKATNSGNIKYSNVTTGNWNTTSSWTPTGVPLATDEVYINEGHTISINSNAVCNNLTINGKLQFTTSNNRSLTISNNLTISSSGEFSTTNLTNTANRSVTIGNAANAVGNLIVNGIFDMAKSNTLFASVIFKGDFSSSISGNGATCKFDNITINKGTDQNSILEVKRSISILSAEVNTTKRLTITNGTFKISAPNSFCLYNNQDAASYTQICTANGRLWLNHPLVSINNPASNIQLSGKNLLIDGVLRISAGTFNYGNGNNYVLVNKSLEITGPEAYLNIYGQLQFGASSNLFMTDGWLNLDPLYSGQTAAFDYNTLQLPTGCLVQCYGGVINFIDPPYSNATNNNALYIESEQNKYFTGTKLRFGNGVSSIAGQNQGFRLNAPTFNNAFYLSDVEVNNPTGSNRFLTLVQHGNGSTNPIRIQNLNVMAGLLNLHTYVRVDSNLINNGSIISKPNGASTTIYFGGNTTISGTSLTTFNNLEIISGYTLRGKLNDNFEVTGNWTNNGTFIHNNGTVTFTSSNGQNIGGSSGTNFNNLTIGGPNWTVANIITPNQTVRSVLSINGTFTTCNECLTLLSTETQTALLDKNMNGTFSGTYKMQRYIPINYGYRYFAIPFQTATVSQFSSWCDLNASFARFYTYDQANDMTGWESYTTPTNTLSPLYGYAVNLGNGNSSTTLELKGQLNNIYGVSRVLVNNNKPFTQGFQLIGNPYPTPIDWTSTGITRNNVDNAIYFFDPSTTDMYGGIYSSFVNGVSTGIANNVIASMQGFFVHASNPDWGNITITLQAGTNNLSPTFHKNTDQKPIQLSITAKSSVGKSSDKAILYLDDNATTSFNSELDALKLFNTANDIPSLYFYDNNNKYSIKATNFDVDSIQISELVVFSPTKATYTIAFDEFKEYAGSKNIILLHKESGLYIDANKETSLTFDGGEQSNNHFKLILAPKNIDIESLIKEPVLKAWNNSGRIQLSFPANLDCSGKVEVFSLQGKLLFETATQDINQLLIKLFVKKQVVIVRFTNSEGSNLVKLIY